MLFDIQEVGERGEHAKFEMEKFLDRLKRIGLIKYDSSLDDVLTLASEDLMERRLQTQVQKQGLANSAKHARQLVVHGHVAVAGRKSNRFKLRSPISEQALVGYYVGSRSAKLTVPRSKRATERDIDHGRAKVGESPISLHHLIIRLSP